MTTKKLSAQVEWPADPEPNAFNMFEVPAGLLFSWAAGCAVYGTSYTEHQREFLKLGLPAATHLLEALEGLKVELKSVASSPEFKRLSGNETTTFQLTTDPLPSGVIRFECDKADDKEVSRLSQTYGVPFDFVVATATACGVTKALGVPPESQVWAVRWILGLVTAALESKGRRVPR